MTHLFDEVPTKLLFTVRHRGMGCVSCERYYYHCRKGERPISPEEQQRIAPMLAGGCTSLDMDPVSDITDLNYWKTPEPVSYTHLDVYKRQSLLSRGKDTLPVRSLRKVLMMNFICVTDDILRCLLYTSRCV